MTVVPLRILIDTNVFIAAESDEEPRHARAQDAAELLSLAARLGHPICVASTIRDDFARHVDPSHRLRRHWQLQRYHMLDPIVLPADFASRAGYPPTVGPSGQVDMTLLLALERSAAQWLVTDDQGCFHTLDRWASPTVPSRLRTRWMSCVGRLLSPSVCRQSKRSRASSWM